MPTNKVPTRPDNRNVVYDVIDGERAYQEEKHPLPKSLHEEMNLLSAYAIKLRAAGKKEDVLDILREIAAISVRAMERVGARPRGWHVPVSAGITGVWSTIDLHDKVSGT